MESGPPFPWAPGIILEGEDILMATMSLAAAKVRCTGLPNCMGFYSEDWPFGDGDVRAEAGILDTNSNAHGEKYMYEAVDLDLQMLVMDVHNCCGMKHMIFKTGILFVKLPGHERVPQRLRRSVGTLSGGCPFQNRMEAPDYVHSQIRPNSSGLSERASISTLHTTSGLCPGWSRSLCG